MIQALGFMVAAYIILRSIELMFSETAHAAVRIFAILVIMATVICTLRMMTAADQVTRVLPGIGGGF